jgi:hypothetical protein
LQNQYIQVRESLLLNAHFWDNQQQGFFVEGISGGMKIVDPLSVDGGLMELRSYPIGKGETIPCSPLKLSEW